MGLEARSHIPQSRLKSYVLRYAPDQMVVPLRCNQEFAGGHVGGVLLDGGGGLFE